MRTLLGLTRKLEQGDALVGGVLSGTSADGITVVLARFPPFDRGRERDLRAPEQVACATTPYPGDLGPRLRAVLDGGACSMRETALLHRDLGRAFGGAAAELAARRSVRLDLLASHGQTVYHHDGVEPTGGATLQLGDADFAALASAACVVSDFRQRDVAAGGHGAPLAPLADGVLFASVPRPAWILNLGGMANLTILERDGRTSGFDTGPAGSLLDGLARRLLDEPFDRSGATAARGRCAEALVREFLDHPYFRARPLKSTGRDTFGAAWVERFLARGTELGVTAAQDMLASGVELVARSVALAGAWLRHAPPTRLFVAGGGLQNDALRAALARNLGRPVASTAEAGVDPAAREGLVFAVLGARALLGIPSTSSWVTGAAEGHVLGRITPPPPVADVEAAG
jgi:anhydro-N-acetylmuramic acid kinase